MVDVILRPEIEVRIHGLEGLVGSDLKEISYSTAGKVS